MSNISSFHCISNEFWTKNLTGNLPSFAKSSTLIRVSFFSSADIAFSSTTFWLKGHMSSAGVERANTFTKSRFKQCHFRKKILSLYLSCLNGNKRDASFLCHKSNMCAFGQLSRVSCHPSTTLIHTLWKRKGPQVTSLNREWSKMTFWAKIIYSKCFQGTKSIVSIVLVAKFW